MEMRRGPAASWFVRLRRKDSGNDDDRLPRRDEEAGLGWALMMLPHHPPPLQISVPFPGRTGWRGEGRLRTLVTLTDITSLLCMT